MSPRALFDWARLPSSDRSVANVWINDDIRPLPQSRRTWNTLTFISFWLTNQIAGMFQAAKLLTLCGIYMVAKADRYCQYQTGKSAGP